MWKQTDWKLNLRPVSRKSNTLPQRHHAAKEKLYMRLREKLQVTCQWNLAGEEREWDGTTTGGD